MIALRGKLERKTETSSATSTSTTTAAAAAVGSTPNSGAEGPLVPAAASAAPTATTTAWHWRGQWAFGTSIAENDPKGLPFHYTWTAAVEPWAVQVPSAEAPDTDISVVEMKDIAAIMAPSPAAVAVAVAVIETPTASAVAETTAVPVAAGGAPKGVPLKVKPAAVDDNKAVGEHKKEEEEVPTKMDIDQPTGEAAPKNESEAADVVGVAVSHKKSTLSIDTEQLTVTESSTTPLVAVGDAATATTVTTTAPTVAPPPPPATPKVTFATKADETDPDFTDATVQHAAACPASGKWTGYFETVADTRKGTTAKVHETCCLFMNSTPPATARIAFVDELENAHQSAEDHKLPVGHVLVRGTGENQYGTFELLGHLDIDTGILECQRIYVRTPASPKSSRTSKSNKKSATSAERSYQTRKRQLSWKRREAIEDEVKVVTRRTTPTGAAAAAATSTTTAGSSTMRPSSRKRARIDSMVSIATLDPNSAFAMGPVVSMELAKLQAAGAAALAKQSQGYGGGGAAAAKRTGSTSRSVTGVVPGHMKLPAAGNPVQARWRAAHFLYYQLSEPTQEQDGTSSGGGSPKYVVYEGDLLNSQREGRGICLYNNRMLYEGEWKRNKEHGQGVLMTSDRKHRIYKGEWERGRMHGSGTYYYSQSRSKKKGPAGGSRYEGDFKENLRHGTGTYVLPDGSTYSGQWREGMMSGRGVFTWPDGDVYEGEWKDNKRHGMGLLKCADGFIYDGMWVQNSMEGRGSATYPNGQQYNGLFSNGRREGRGTILFPNGAVYEGRFRNDAVDGQGTMKMSRTLVVPRSSSTLVQEGEENNEEDAKDDFMIPLYFQSNIGHIHRKAGFTVIGE